MSGHNKGKCIGGIRTLDDLYGRCMVEPGDECWHLRRADGKPIPRDYKRLGVHVFEFGSISALRAAWFLSHGQFPPAGLLTYRLCTSYDCVNPAHLRCGTKAQMGAFHASTGRHRGNPERCAINSRNISSRRIITEELRLWIRESTQTAEEIAQVLGVAASTVYKYANGKHRPPLAVASSVFDFRGSIGITAQVEATPKSERHVRDHKGWSNPMAKLSHQQLMAICKRFDSVGERHQPGDKLKWRDKVAGRETLAAIAQAFDITRSHVWRIGTGRAWGHVTGRSQERIAA